MYAIVITEHVVYSPLIGKILDIIKKVKGKHTDRDCFSEYYKLNIKTNVQFFDQLKNKTKKLLRLMVIKY